MDKKQEEVWNLFDKRSSIRSFINKKIDEETIKFLLECGVTAPSSGNMQPWEFIVVRDEKIKKKIVECTYFGYFSKGGDHQNWILEASIIIVACANQKRTRARYGETGNLSSIIDTSAAIENILLAASGIGLGGCWVGGVNEEKLKEILKIPSEVKPVGILPIGYPKEDVERKHRMESEIIRHNDYYNH